MSETAAIHDDSMPRPATDDVPLTVVIPVLNEEKNLPDALASVAWAREVFVVDSGSTDQTCAIAERHGARVIQFAYTDPRQKKKAWTLVSLPFATDWVLFLDADERVTPELRDEIHTALTDPTRDGYYVDREMIFRGRPLRSYRPDWNLRLFRHRLASVEDLGMHDVPGTGDNEIHEHFQLEGTRGFLRMPLRHDDYRGIGPWVDRHNRYATWEAHLYARLRAEPLALDPRALRDPVRRNRLLRRIWVRLPARPILRFAVWYLGKRAVLDGRNGLMYSLLMAWYELLIGLKLSELEYSSVPQPGSQ